MNIVIRCVYDEECIKCGILPWKHQPIYCVDGVPDKDLAIRLLKGFRNECEATYIADANAVDAERALVKFISDQNNQRLRFIDEAIKKLRS